MSKTKQPPSIPQIYLQPIHQQDTANEVPVFLHSRAALYSSFIVPNVGSPVPSSSLRISRMSIHLDRIKLMATSVRRRKPQRLVLYALHNRHFSPLILGPVAQHLIPLHPPRRAPRTPSINMERMQLSKQLTSAILCSAVQWHELIWSLCFINQ